MRGSEESGQLVIVPAGVPHRFVNSADGPLRQIDATLSPSFATEWLEEADDPSD